MTNIGIIQTKRDKTMTQTAFCENTTGITQRVLKKQQTSLLPEQIKLNCGSLVQRLICANQKKKPHWKKQYNTPVVCVGIR
jgi:hypothetical protein